MRHVGSLFVTLGIAVFITAACGSTKSNGEEDASAGTRASGGSVDFGGASAGPTGPGGVGDGGAIQLGGAPSDAGGAIGRGGDAPSDGGAAPVAACKTFEDICVESSDCCSGVCDPNTNTCLTRPMKQREPWPVRVRRFACSDVAFVRAPDCVRHRP